MIITYIRTIPPIYKTTNIAVFYEEVKLRPSEIELNLISQLYIEIRESRVEAETCINNTNVEVFDAKITITIAGAAKALTLVSIKLVTDLWIFLDNYEVVLRLGSYFNGSLQRVFEDFLKLIQAWAVRSRLPHTSPGKIRVRWVPGHLDILNNEITDKAAKEGTKLPFPLNPICTLVSLKRMIKIKANKTNKQL
ncbi:hypothetical protein SS1G_03391 [Sclerotinia sclerotiorum 1980 UF-70]|uniref:RNase H type-1 domain-containing protein n=1 Tax=Sclerotinia sclerotiorum (strain ATCC 18683 / 1980 / Ss-1) TaxID=665079 RepID=A7EDK1_SCLS1|nr:hypothetical protein SS1G_03391 [Sclerotinia sclerotiorum 1980 UF-70]EDO00917.1 hypothetical protein SS1G_03391 [Sclerotinia sclerotiorum 1980 UF-70]